MNFQYSPFILPLIAASLLSGWVASYAWSRRALRSAVALALLALAIAQWSLGYAFEVAARDLPTKLLFARFEYIGITIAPLAWAIFAYNYAYQSRPLRHRVMMALGMLPLITVLLVFTNGIHQLVWTGSRLVQAGPLLSLVNSFGPWFWVHSAYSYLLLLAGTVIVLRALSQNRSELYRGQTTALLIAVLAPWIGNVLYLGGISPVPNFDLTPFAFTITVLSITWGIFGFRLMDLTPLARHIVVEEMNDGMIVVDALNRVADLNPAAERIIERPAAQVIGQHIVDILKDWQSVMNRFQEFNALGREAEAQEEIVVGQGAERHWFEVRLAPLKDHRKRLAGRVITFRDVTERKQQEGQLRFQAAALTSVANAIVITTPDGLIQWVNPAFTTLTGYSAEESVGQSTRLLRSGTHDPAYYQRMWNTILSGKVWHGEMTNRRKDGSLYFEEQVITPVSNEQGQITQFISIKQDITERKRIEQRIDGLIREQEIILNNIPVGVVFQRDHKVAWANPVAIHMSGYAPEEMHGMETLLVYPDSGAAQQFAESVNRQMISGEIFSTEIQLKRKDGSLLWCSLAGQAINPAHLHEDGILWVAQDITEKRQADEQLRQLSRAVEDSPASIVITDPRGKIEYVNPKFCEVTGYTREEALGQNPRILKTEQTPAQVHLELWAALQAGEEWRGEFCNRKKNGELYWELALISPIQDASGTTTHYVAIKEDITERKRTEEALALAYDQALEASRLKSQLLAKVSHELRTPLGGILGFAELMLHNSFGELTTGQHQATAQIVESAQYLNMMVNELLDEAQIASKSLVLHMDYFSPQKVLKRVESNMMVLAQNKGLRLETSIAPDLPSQVYGDAQRLQQILINLAGNAIKFTPAGEVCIHLYRHNSTHWAMRVLDSGVGIPKDALGYIFEPFRQVDNAITHQNRGTGLGLSITRQLVEMMNGQIYVESEVGKGSAFTIILPLTEKPENAS